ncbi:hypothetical protein C8R44DRAFT_805752, partial [Mycena epipterygia]
ISDDARRRRVSVFYSPFFLVSSLLLVFPPFPAFLLAYPRLPVPPFFLFLIPSPLCSFLVFSLLLCCLSWPSCRDISPCGVKALRLSLGVIPPRSAIALP